MGDYIGEDDSQLFEDIIVEKLSDVCMYEKCLWSAAGPNLLTFKSFKQKYGFGDDKKLYAIFSMTTSQYKNGEIGYYAWREQNGKGHIVLTDTSPKSNHIVKALIIDKFWIIEEDFLVDDFYNHYYRYELPTWHSADKKYHLPNDVKSCSRTMQCVVAKKEILRNGKLQEDLGLKDELFEDFKKEICNAELKYNEEEHPIFYILAEVLDYVELEELK